MNTPKSAKTFSISSTYTGDRCAVRIETLEEAEAQALELSRSSWEVFEIHTNTTHSFAYQGTLYKPVNPSSSPQDAEETYATNVLKSQITDLDTAVFESVDPLKVEAYLKANEWTLKKESTEMDIWGISERGTHEHHNAWVPKDRSFVDFGLVMKRVIKEIANFENSMICEVLDDINRIEL